MSLPGATSSTTSRDGKASFYVGVGALCLALPLAGFFETYLVPVATGRFGEPAIVHLHALFAFGWVALFVLQGSLIAHGRVVRHEAFGLAGIALATGMCFTGIIVASKAMSVGIDAGRAPARAPSRLSR